MSATIKRGPLPNAFAGITKLGGGYICSHFYEGKRIFLTSCPDTDIKIAETRAVFFAQMHRIPYVREWIPLDRPLITVKKTEGSWCVVKYDTETIKVCAQYKLPLAPSWPILEHGRERIEVISYEDKSIEETRMQAILAAQTIAKTQQYDFIECMDIYYPQDNINEEDSFTSVCEKICTFLKIILQPC